MIAHLSVQPLLFRLRASYARVFPPALPPAASGATFAQAAPAVESPGGDAGPSHPPTQRWQMGFDAFGRGELAPADPMEADGWYWAENAASRRFPQN